MLGPLAAALKFAAVASGAAAGRTRSATSGHLPSLVLARSPSGKAKVCKTFIGGSIPPRASRFAASLDRDVVQITSNCCQMLWVSFTSRWKRFWSARPAQSLRRLRRRSHCGRGSTAASRENAANNSSLSRDIPRVRSKNAANCGRLVRESLSLNVGRAKELPVRENA